MKEVPHVDLVFDFDPAPEDVRLLRDALAFVGYPCDVVHHAPNTIRVSHTSGTIVAAAMEWYRSRGWSRGRGDEDPT